MGGVGALGGALVHQASLLEAGQREVQEAVSTIAFGETVAEIGQHAEWKIPQVTGMLTRSLARA
ncbi:hypothetical protein GCM10010094_94370 [Streptomyces flaveus]|uniref:Uncharacterized protein n=1 Tax=Streptomyces flaveus TaxID=66370 RepID=A0A917VUB0_9ACTN|nr:hypothetical protein GCM10010094_94370 [Streptomyces flaveus]